MKKETPNSLDRKQTEQNALRISGYGALALAVLGIGFAIHSGSKAILLDGLFSVLGFFMALMTLYVSRLVSRPDDEVFQYGYALFAPLMNVLKSLVMTVLCGFAFFSAVSTLLAGGQPMAVGSAVLYALISTLIGAGLFIYLRKVAEQTASVLVSLDAKAARLDMFLSAAVLVSFVLGWFSIGTRMERHLDLLDPLVVAGLCLVVLPVPLKVLWNNGREVLLFAPDADVQQSVKDRIESAIEGFPFEDYKIRMLKLGNVLAVTLHLRPADDFRIEGVGDLDRVRLVIEDALAPLDFEIGLDIMFVKDMRLAR
ncbi:MAG: cation diffusion facilitator family transporter [Lysobacterales bacterium]|jgi:cation diffusion facilitator family transporter